MITARIDTRKAHALLMRAGVKLCRDSAEHARDVARSRAAVDSGEMRAKTVSVDTPSGGELQANADHSVFLEFGTGIYNSRGGGRTTPWTYRRSDGAFVTTSGNAAQPFLRPGFRAGVQYFNQEKRRGM